MPFVENNPPGFFSNLGSFPPFSTNLQWLLLKQPLGQRRQHQAGRCHLHNPHLRSGEDRAAQGGGGERRGHATAELVLDEHVIGCLFVCSLVGLFVSFFVGWLVCLFVGWLVGWLVGLFVCLFLCLFLCLFVCLFLCLLVCWFMLCYVYVCVYVYVVFCIWFFQPTLLAPMKCSHLFRFCLMAPSKFLLVWRVSHSPKSVPLFRNWRLGVCHIYPMIMCFFDAIV